MLQVKYIFSESNTIVLKNLTLKEEICLSFKLQNILTVAGVAKRISIF